jgi:hypothetical protein
MYTGNCLPEGEKLTNPNTWHKPYAAILLETSQFNDCVNHMGKKGWPENGGLLSMGEVYNHTTVHKFSNLNHTELQKTSQKSL